MGEISVLSGFIEGATEASSRVRASGTIAAVACVIILSAAWNNRAESWNDQNLGHLKDQIVAAEAELTRLVLVPQGEPQYEFNVDKQKEVLTRLRELEKILQVKALEVQFFSVDALGVSFHINDLGFLSGVALNVILVWLLIALEHRDLAYRALFDEAESKGRLAECYRLMAIRQFFTFPEDAEEPHHRSPKSFLKLLSVFPCFVHLYVVYTDILTYRNAIDYYEGVGRHVLLSTSCFALALLLSILILKRSRQYDILWQTAAEEIRKQSS